MLSAQIDLSLTRSIFIPALFVVFWGQISAAESLVNSDILRRLSPAIVLINAQGVGRNWQYATGFVWGRPDQVVTAYHVVSTGRRIQVYFRQRDGYGVSSARILRASEESDLAILQLDNPYNDIIPLEPTAIPAMSDSLTIAGYPLGLRELHSHFLQPSTVQAKSLRAHIPEDILKDVEAFGVPDLDLNVIAVEGGLMPGYSGAPVFSDKGDLVGIGNGGLERGAIDLGWLIPVAKLVELDGAAGRVPENPSTDFQDATAVLFGAGPALDAFEINGSNAKASLSVTFKLDEDVFSTYSARILPLIEDAVGKNRHQELTNGYSRLAEFRTFHLSKGSPLYFDTSERSPHNPEFNLYAIFSSLWFSFSCYTEQGLKGFLSGQNVPPKLQFSLSSDFGQDGRGQAQAFVLGGLNPMELEFQLAGVPVGGLPGNVEFGKVVTVEDGYENIATFFSGGCSIHPYFYLPSGTDEALKKQIERLLHKASYAASLDLGTGIAMRFHNVKSIPIGGLKGRRSAVVAYFPQTTGQRD